MFTGLISRLFAIKAKESEQELRRVIEEKNLEINRLKAELMGKELLLKKSIAIVDARVGDPEPQGSDRKDYVMSVTNFYTDIGKKKLHHLIAVTRENLDQIYQDLPPGIDRTRYDDFLRGTSNAFKVLIDWFELLQGEHNQNVTNQGIN
jgi:hypothetical protein